MDRKFEKFLQKNDINPDNILYLLRSKGKTVIHLNDGRTVETFTPLKTLVDQLAPLPMLSINKRISLNEGEIISVEKGLYTMADGATFQGRIRTPGAHSRKAQLINHHLPAPIHIPKNLAERFSILDHMPLGFCVIEIVFDQEQHGLDFIFRYCNKAMAEIEGKTIEEILNRSCFEVFPEREKKWAIAYADVALNSVTRSYTDYHPTHNTAVTIHCFQPLEGYCACVLVPHMK